METSRALIGAYSDLGLTQPSAIMPFSRQPPKTSPACYDRRIKVTTTLWQLDNQSNAQEEASEVCLPHCPQAKYAPMCTVRFLPKELQS